MRKNKAYSMIEVLVAGALAMMLGILVATTLNSATKSLRSTNYKVQANNKARELSSFLQKYISSADKRSYCEPNASTCQNFIKYDQDSFLSNYYINSNGYQFQFFSYLCSSINASSSNNQSSKNCSNNQLKNPAEITIIYEKDTSAINSTIKICRSESGNGILVKNDIVSGNPIPTVKKSCDSSNIVFQTNGVAEVGSSSIVQFIKTDGSTYDCKSISNILCIQQATGAKILLDVIWDLKENDKINSRGGVKASRVELYIPFLGGSQ